MKRLLAVAAFAASCSLTPVLAHAKLTCDLTVSRAGDRIEAHVALSGLSERGPGSVTIEWTSPQEGQKDQMFLSSSYEAHWRAATSQQDEECKGCTRTWAYRTVSYTYKGKNYVGAGVWKVRVVSGTVVLAEASITVQ